MKKSCMPTISNTTPLESYSDYKDRKFNSIIEMTKEIILLINNSSLTASDKKLALLQVEFDIKKSSL